MNITDAIYRATQGLRLSITAMISKSIVRSASDDKDNSQIFKVEAFSDEAIEDVESYGHYGFSSSVPVGSEAILICVGGDRSHPVVISTKNSKGKPKLELGEVAIYHPSGAVVKLKSGGIEIVSSNSETKENLPITITASEVTISGTLKVKGDVTFEDGVSLAGLREKYNAHSHDDKGLPPKESDKV